MVPNKYEPYTVGYRRYENPIVHRNRQTKERAGFVQAQAFWKVTACVVL